MSQPAKKEKKIHSYYEIKNGTLSRRLKKCPRCSTFMANHQVGRPRWACGGCSYTEYMST
ncbi:MAG: 30S ribosomal protein S27ae [Candidatus Bathyarchaeota archaeon]|nr:MAG: 30S ribosomal protein S27ae [Candidatus Bathyarchaeota archaeon]